MSGSSGLDLNGVAVEVVRHALDSEYILQVEPTGSPDHLYAGCEGESSTAPSCLVAVAVSQDSRVVARGNVGGGGSPELEFGLFKMPADTQVEM